VYLDGYIYAMKNDQGGFGRHQLSGALGNWQTLASHPSGALGIDVPGSRNLCTDGVRYIYCIDYSYYRTTKRFVRFDTIGLTWASLSNAYFVAGAFSGSHCIYSNLRYGNDGVKDYIYYFGGRAGGTFDAPPGEQWVQRYDVSANTWLTQYLDTRTFNTAYSSTLDTRLMLFHDKKLWFKFSGMNTSLFCYDITTDVLATYTVNFDIYAPSSAPQELTACYGLAVEPDFDKPAKLYIGNVVADRTSLYVWPGNPGVTYTTPIFKLDNKYNASYFIIDGTAVSGTGSISYDPDVYNGSIRVRSSDIEPIPSVEAWWIYRGNPSTYCGRYIPYTNTRTTPVSSTIFDVDGGTFIIYCQVAANNLGRMAMSMTRNVGSTYNSYLFIVNRSGNLSYSLNSAGDWPYRFGNALEFDKWGGVWGYDSDTTHGTNRKLVHYNYNLTTTLASLYDGSDFLYDLSVEYEGDGVWYTNKNTNQIINLNSSGVTLLTINQRQPRALCSNPDGTVWVCDSADSKFRKFNSSGIILLEKNIDGEFTKMRSDFDGGFWSYSASVDNVYHYNSSGIKDLDIHFDRIDEIKPSYEGCMVYDANSRIAYFMNFQGVIYRSTSLTSGHLLGPAVFSTNFDQDRKWGQTIVPTSYDPVWKSAGISEWEEVKKDGYFLPKVRFHQAEITLRGYAILEKVILAPAVKTQDIAPGTSKNIYVRTNIPEDADIKDYATKLRSWWGEVE
jgi:hypothetical protein